MPYIFTLGYGRLIYYIFCGFVFPIFTIFFILIKIENGTRFMSHPK